MHACITLHLLKNLFWSLVGSSLVFGEKELGHCYLGIIGCRRVCVFVGTTIWSRRISVDFTILLCTWAHQFLDHLDAYSGDFAKVDRFFVMLLPLLPLASLNCAFKLGA
ncbi:hypothetical protein L6452_21598 [Arctium lappa]|uniref:Uncharacterized protein n=1 Tax=Arctium lappa TaxID=4217 RepID=A0ACB9B1U9_ARCLA|nr:hypothetical protein L6452_21598 [Arctium lappa]